MLIKRFFTLIFLASLFHGCGTGYGPASPTNEQIQDTTVNDINILKVANPHLTVVQGNTIYTIQDEEYNLYKSTDSGETFELIFESPDDLSSNNTQALFLTPEGTLLWSYITYTYNGYSTYTYSDERGEGRDELNIHIFRSTDQGQTFEESLISTTRLYEAKASLEHIDGQFFNPCNLFAMDWVISENANSLYLILAFDYESSAIERTLQFITSNDDGQTFSDLQDIPRIDSSNISNGSIISLSASEDYLFIAGHSFGLLKFSPVQVESDITSISNPVEESTLGKQHIKYTNNVLYMLYQTNPYESHLLSDYLIKSTDNGNSFSEPMLAASVDASTLRWGYEDFDVYEDNMYILWSRQKTSGDDYNGAMYLAQSSDGGETFGEIERISDYGLTDIWGDLYIDYQGNVFVFWTDSSMNSER